MQWLRWWAGTIHDPKIGLWASLAGLTKAEGLAVFISLLESASEADDRGDVTRFDVDATAFWFQIDAPKVRKFIDVMIERGSIANGRLANWEKRQPSDYSTGRVRKFREKQKRSRNGKETNGNGAKRDETPGNAQNRTEQNRIDPPTPQVENASPAKPPLADDPSLSGEETALTWMGDEASADRQLRWLGAILDELPERDRKPVTDFTRMATNGRTLTAGQVELLATLFQRHRVAIVDESNRRLAKRFPDLIEAMKHPKHGREVAAAAARRDDRELDRLLKIVRDDITSLPPFLRRGAAA